MQPSSRHRNRRRVNYWNAPFTGVRPTFGAPHLTVWLVLACICGCGGEPQFELTVNLRTDYQPVREFAFASVQVDSELSTLLAEIDGDYVRPGEPLASFKGLAPSDSRGITVSLNRLGGGELASTRVLVQHQTDLIITIAITRDCAGVDCSSTTNNRRCLQGVCVDARCAAGHEPFCTELAASCAIDSECATTSACASARCEDGVCFEDAQAHTCDTNEICSLEDGCVPAPDPGGCSQDIDCVADDGSDGCILATCTTGPGLCVYSFASDGTACGQGSMCRRGACEDHCANFTLDGNETDIDCGGSCPGCGLGSSCLAGADCASGICDTLGSMTCEPANTCGNGTIEAGEACDDGNTGTGDGCNAACLIENGSACTLPTDCESAFCAMDGFCRPPTCQNTMLDGTETDTDCGGDCAPCSGGSMCMFNDDCASQNCFGGVCSTEPAHCRDGITSGDEMGADCGGSCLKTCVVYDCASQTEIPLLECEKLKDLYNAANGPNWANTVGWFADANPCSWAGLNCTAVPGNIDEVVVFEDELNGVIARGLDTLSFLADLTLSTVACCTTRTNLAGNIPAEIGNLNQLAVLDLGENALSGSMPIELGSLTNLTNFTVSRNQLSGPIPSEIGQLINVTRLFLQDNTFTGSIPSEIGQLTLLAGVQLYANQLTGSIPPEVGQLTAVDKFYVRNNQLSGPIPAEIGQLTLLLELYLHTNQLSGSIPNEIGSLVNLQVFHAASNQLSGAIPSDISMLTNLTDLQLGGNQLTGMIPTTITNLSALTRLNICSQAGSLTSDMATGTWLRGIIDSDWPAGDSC